MQQLSVRPALPFFFVLFYRGARMAENYSKANEQLKAEEAAKAERKAAKEAAKKAKQK